MFLEHEFNPKQKPVQYWLWLNWDSPPLSSLVVEYKGSSKMKAKPWKPVLPCDHLYNLHGLSWESSCACSFLRPFCWSYVLYRLLQSLWTTFLEAMFSWYITFSCSLRGYGPKNRICTKNSAIIPRCTPNIIVTTRMTWNILKLRNPNEKNLYLLYSILTAGFGNQKKIATNLLSAQPAPQQSTKSSQESRIYLPFKKKKRALAKIDEERNNQWHDKSPKIVLNWLET